jgi:CubicO group peptidase (beta-lactamase class C family)
MVLLSGAAFEPVVGGAGCSRALVQIGSLSMLPPDVAIGIDDQFAFTRQGRHPGAAVMVIHDGVVQHRQGYGLADLEKGTPISSETAFYLCSLAKAFTAMAVMLLAESGQVGYDAPLRQFVPELPPYAEQITIRHLLHHTSGLPDYFQLSKRADLAEITGFTNADVLRWLCRLEVLDFPPGERRQYSNAGYVLLATLVARAAGQPFQRFLQERIFAPLGMARTLVCDETGPIVPQLAHGYFGGSAPEGGDYQRWDYNLRTAGGGGIFSSIDDLYRWDQALYTERLVSAATLRDAWTPGHLNNGSTFGYGFGWEIGSFRCQRQLAHSGNLAPYHARYLRFPDERWSVIVLANADRADAVACAEQIAALCLPA